MLMSLIGVHLLLAVLAPLLTRGLGHRAFWLAAALPALGFGWLLTLGPEVLAGGVVAEAVPWIPGLGVELSFRIGL
ncbi:MAG TPA: hypothetical protein PLE12_08335, partial [Propionicimonas sp.]|nr:hypothetical protein [Propionicimonas sp.]